MRDFVPNLWRLAAVVGVALATTSAAALDSVTVNVVGADDKLKGRLENASLLMQALNEQEAARRATEPKWYKPWRGEQPPPATPDPADTLATARAEYQRMVSVLYSQGYYGGVVSVKIDGREARGGPPAPSPSREGGLGALGAARTPPSLPPSPPPGRARL